RRKAQQRRHAPQCRVVTPCRPHCRRHRPVLVGSLVPRVAHAVGGGEKRPAARSGCAHVARADRMAVSRADRHGWAAEGHLNPGGTAASTITYSFTHTSRGVDVIVWLSSTPRA